MARAKSTPNKITVEGKNEFAESEQKRRGFRHEGRRLFILGILCAVVVFAAWVLPTYMFDHSQMQFTPAVFINVVAYNFDSLLNVFVAGGQAGESRFMAVVVCAVSGAALGMCGSAYQGAFNNPLAAPKTLGIMAGGALGALIYVLFLQGVGPKMPGLSSGSYTYAQQLGWLSSLNPFEWLWVNYGKCLCSMAGCFIVVAIVLALTSAFGRGKLSNVVVIIFGQVFAATVTAIISFMRYASTSAGSIDTADELREIENYTMIQEFHYIDLLIIVLPILICMVVILLMSRRLTLLSFGDDEANTMGINVNRTRYALIAVCTIMTAFAISFCGHVAYLGFISAHLARRIVGPNFRYLLPASLFVGASLLTVIQYICQSGLPNTSPYSAGVVCSIVGATLFIVIVLTQRGKAFSGGWR